MASEIIGFPAFADAILMDPTDFPSRGAHQLFHLYSTHLSYNEFDASSKRQTRLEQAQSMVVEDVPSLDVHKLEVREHTYENLKLMAGHLACFMANWGNPEDVYVGERSHEPGLILTDITHQIIRQEGPPFAGLSKLGSTLWARVVHYLDKPGKDLHRWSETINLTQTHYDRSNLQDADEMSE